MILLLPLLAGCPAPNDTGSADSGGRDAFCQDVPLVDYNNFGEGFVLANCQGCHATTTVNRYDAPENVTFDTVDQVWTWSPNILAIATGDTPAMPPRGGIEPDDRTRLEWWLRCAPPGT